MSASPWPMATAQSREEARAEPGPAEADSLPWIAMAKTYREILQIEAAKVAAGAASGFGHPGAKGDQREVLLLDFVRERLGSSFAIDKGEIIDSLGNTTGEIDGILYDNRLSAAVTRDGHRKVIRVESVVATIEVKSELRRSDLDELDSGGNHGLASLRRFYADGPLLPTFRGVQRIANRGSRPDEVDEVEQLMSAGALARESVTGKLPYIASFVFGYTGFSGQLDRADNAQWDVVCILDDYCASVAPIGHHDPAARVFVYGSRQNALPAFLFRLEQCMVTHMATSNYVVPAWDKYFNSIEAFSKTK